MLTEKQFKEIANLKSKAYRPWYFRSLVWRVICFGIFSRIQSSPGPLVVILFLLLFFVPTCALISVGLSRASRINLHCPICSASIGQSLNLLRKTHACPHCGQKILEMKVHSIEVVERHRRHRQWAVIHRSYLLLWGIVLIQAAFHFEVYFSSLAPFFSPEIHLGLPFVNIGLISLSVYVWFRTRNSRCTYPLLLSVFMTSCEFWLTWIEFRMS